jgi:CBS domain containing-hemolysin-like protein
MDIFIALAGLFLSGSVSLMRAFVHSNVEFRTNEFPVSEKIIAALTSAKEQYSFTILSLHIADILSTFIVATAFAWTAITACNDPLYLIYAEFIAFFSIVVIKYLARIIGSRKPLSVAAITVISLKILLFCIKPFAWITTKTVQFFGGEEPEDTSRKELDALVENAHVEGSIDPEEYRLMKSLMRFSSVEVADVMTPRTVVFSLHQDETVENALQSLESRQYSRFPIWEGSSIDGVNGYVMTKDIMWAALRGNKTATLKEFSRNVYFIPDSAELDKALEQFIEREQHQFIVVDEYGGIEGLITLEDVMETMLGVEIVDEDDNVVDLRELAKQRRDKRVASHSIFKENTE